jgi:hypothetical protein
MKSRTADGKHTKRFIVEYFDDLDNTWVRSGNTGISGAFATREEAQAAMVASRSDLLKYHVRQK